MNTDICIADVVLRTERLTLRAWKESDLEDFYEYARVDGVGQMAGWLPHENIEKSREILQHFLEKKVVFAIEYRGKVIGSLGIERYDEEKHPELAELQARELGYVLSKDYWGMGLMPEAVREVLRYLFEEVGVDAVTCGYFIRNKQSARVQEKCGFRYHSTGKFTTRYGAVEDEISNILWKDDWQKMQ